MSGINVNTTTITLPSEVASLNEGQFSDPRIWKSGYNPIGIVGLNISGTGATNIAIQKFYINGTTAGINLYNRGSSTTNMTVSAYILYQQGVATLSDDTEEPMDSMY